MKRLLPTFLALLSLLLSCQNVDTRVWRASGGSGDKPGIGFELRKHAEEISGFAFLLDPDFPNDFSHTGFRRAMTFISQSPNEIRFRVAWSRLPQRHLCFGSKGPIGPIHSGLPRFQFAGPKSPRRGYSRSKGSNEELAGLRELCDARRTRVGKSASSRPFDCTSTESHQHRPRA